MFTVTPATRVSEIRHRLLGDTRATDGRVNPRLVQSIQQSLAVEGYPVTEDAVRAVGERLEK